MTKSTKGKTSKDFIFRIGKDSEWRISPGEAAPSLRDKENVHVLNWGDFLRDNRKNLFRKVRSLTVESGIAPPVFGPLSSLEGMFTECHTLTPDFMGEWDVRRVVNFDYMFHGARVFNGDISRWRTTSAETMRYMFTSARAFNGDISGWDVSRVYDMRGMFWGASEFNQDISSWDVGLVLFFDDFLSGAYNFKGRLDSWDLSGVESKRRMMPKEREG